MDETHVDTNPGLAKTWQRRGMPRRIAAAGTNRRLSVFGALDAVTGTVTSLLTDRADSAAFQHFLTVLVARYPSGPLLLVMDNAAYHKSRPIRIWLAEHRDRLQVLFQPTYSPHLNPIERVWRMLKHRLACHGFWNDHTGLRDHTQRLLDSTVAHIGRAPCPTLRMRQNICMSA